MRVFYLKCACVDVSVDKRPDTTRNCPAQRRCQLQICTIADNLHTDLYNRRQSAYRSVQPQTICIQICTIADNLQTDLHNRRQSAYRSVQPQTICIQICTTADNLHTDLYNRRQSASV
ncbi:hypothetical protein J6590_008141 [Homalodisca vitripennis]|nr:hypothetical protein J6590_008141 [Homalodisca vitripennis]